MSETVTTAAELFEYLSAQIPNQAWHQAISNHVKAKSGHASLIAYERNGATEEDKIALYTEIIMAIEANNLAALQGAPAKGQAVAPANEPKSDPEPIKPRITERVVEPRFTIPTTDEDPVVKLREALEAIGIKSKTEFDPKQIDSVIEAKLKAREIEAMAAINKAIADAVKNLPPRAAIEIKEGKEIREIKGVFHRQLPQAVAWISADVPLWYWGEAGGGKTTLANQIAEALGLKPYLVAMHEDITVGKLLGYRNLANGEFVPGLLYEPYVNGGLVALDEIDLSAPAIACINALIANKTFMFPNGETVPRHPKFRVVAFGNTKGTGAVAGYTARNRLDAATLDRFAIIKLEYDEGLEHYLATGNPTESKPWQMGTPGSVKLVERWVDWVQACRRVAGGSVLISPRITENGAKALKAGIPAEEVAEALMFKLVTPDTKARLLREAGVVPHE